MKIMSSTFMISIIGIKKGAGKNTEVRAFLVEI